MSQSAIPSGTPQPLPPRRVETLETTVVHMENLTPGVRGIRFQLPTGKEIHFKSGQYVMAKIPLKDGKTRQTAYSIASPPQGINHVDLCVTLVPGGVSSTFLHGLKVGDKLPLMGPIGKFTMVEPSERDIVFVATGSGVAPFHSMILDLISRNTKRNIFLVYGNRFVEDIIYRKEWEALAAAHSNFKFLFTLSRPDDSWKGTKGYVQDVLAPFVPGLPGKDVYICGLARMIEGVRARCEQEGIPKEQVHFERYD
jgi:CDP-4-dehydro-6-deoxyglucose reductase, E3